MVNLFPQILRLPDAKRSQWIAPACQEKRRFSSSWGGNAEDGLHLFGRQHPCAPLPVHISGMYGLIPRGHGRAVRDPALLRPELPSKRYLNPQ